MDLLAPKDFPFDLASLDSEISGPVFFPEPSDETVTAAVSPLFVEKDLGDVILGAVKTSESSTSPQVPFDPLQQQHIYSYADYREQNFQRYCCNSIFKVCEQNLDEIIESLSLEQAMDQAGTYSGSEYSPSPDTSRESVSSDLQPHYTYLNDLNAVRTFDPEPRQSPAYNIGDLGESHSFDSDENNENVNALYMENDPDDDFLVAAETPESPSSPQILFDPLQHQYSYPYRDYPHRPSSIYQHCLYDNYTDLNSAYTQPTYMSSSCNSLGHDLPPLNIPNLPSLHDESPRVSYQYGNFGDGDSGEETDSEIPAKRGRRGSKSVLLWRFLLDSLKDPECCPEKICWENREKGIFKFVDTAGVAMLWGKKKHKQDMNFEKLSRGIRHYYKGGMMKREEGKRLVYKFNWKKVPREYRYPK